MAPARVREPLARTRTGASRAVAAALAAALAGTLAAVPARAESKRNADAELREEAERRMNISFDYEEVQGQLARPKSAAPALHGRPGQPPVARAPLPLVPNSSVTEVTVYRDRALVTRQRAVEVGAGEAAVEFVGLPLGVRPESFHAGIASGEAEVLAVERLTGEGLLQRQAEQEQIREGLRPLVDAIGASRDRTVTSPAEAYMPDLMAL